MIICLGEIIADLTSQEPGRPLWAVSSFKKHLGGSPANVAIGLAYHGVPVRLWSKVGDDSLGRFLCHTLEQHGVSTREVVIDPLHRTGIALVGLDDDLDRTFEMHNTAAADQFLRPDEVDTDAFNMTRIFHIGGTTLLGTVTSETTLGLLEAARRIGTLVTFDPNIQIAESTIPGEVIRQRLDAVLRLVDVLKMSTTDWADLLGDTTPRTLLDSGISLIILTDGPRGARLITRRHDIVIPAEPLTPVDATGAGDAFTAAFFKHLVEVYPETIRIDRLAASELRRWGLFAATWARRILQHPGATTAYRAD